MKATGYGPELLAGRRSFKGRVTAEAAALDTLTRGGGERLNGLNMDRLCRPGEAGPRHGRAVQQRRDRKCEEFRSGLAIVADELRTGLVFTSAQLEKIAAASRAIRW